MPTSADCNNADPCNPTTTTTTTTSTTTSTTTTSTTTTTLPPPTVIFAAYPTTIFSGQISQLSWTTSDATGVSIDQNLGAQSLSGSTTVNPSATTTYTLTAIGPGGTTTAQVTITIYSLSKIVVTPNPGTTPPGGTIPFTATAEDAVGNPLATQPTFTWTNAHPALGSINASGVLTASTAAVAGTYSNEVTATAGTIAGSADVIVVTTSVPSLYSLNPSSAAAGGPGFSMTLVGSNFVTNSIVEWNGLPRPTTFVSPTQLSALISSSDIASIGVTTVTVVNPVPGGSSNGLPFRIVRVCRRIIVDPDGQTISPKDILPFHAHAYDQFGEEIPDITFIWQTSGPSGVISAAGIFEVNGPLFDNRIVYTITASSGNVSGVAHVTVVLAPTASGGICGAYAYPVPYKSTMTGGITFTGLGPASRIRIFSTDARLVRQLESANGEDVLWDIRNSDGQKVASWVYIYIIDQDGPCKTKEGKLVVIQ